jgi:tetratricopeptide (TPR) repeat protein
MNAMSALDDHTANAIRDALRAASAGRLHEAAEIGERALAAGGDPAALNAMIGAFRLRAGDREVGIRHLRKAHLNRPADPVIAANLAGALAEAGEYDDIPSILTEELAQRDPSMRMERLRAFGAQMGGDFQTAIASYERVVAAQPADWESWNNLGNCRRSFGDFRGSVKALERAVALTPDSPPVRLNHALAVANSGSVEEGERLLRAIAETFPEDSMALTELHSLYKGQARDDEALEAIHAAVGRAPRDIDLLLGLASHQLSMLLTDAAEETYRRAVMIQPDNGPANLGLGLVLELTNRAEALSNLVNEARARGVQPNASNFLQALDHRRAKRFAEGLEALSKVPEEIESPRRFHLLGQLYEGDGEFDQAFAAFAKMNENHAADPSQPGERAAAYRHTIATQRETVDAAWLARWRKADLDDKRPSPVFLVGFPRSGTTLLDTMLMGHDGLEILEEEPPLRYATSLLPGLSEIPDATDAQIGSARDEYFRAAAKLTPLAPGKLLIDKNPLAMNGLPMIARLFPDARIILALRHPCDVVLSCFVTNFKLNAGMSNFLSLESAAELYDLSFSFFEHVQQLMPIPTHRVVYENVVTDQEGELRSLLDFLSIDWHDDVLDHQTTARGRGRIKTASYAQVFEPIYKRSAGRWQNYRRHLEPILPKLKPWVEKFGYEL